MSKRAVEAFGDQDMNGILEGANGEMSGEMWIDDDHGRLEQEEEDNLLDASNFFYSDFPPLPHFPCMSSSSSSSVKPVAAKSSSYSASSSSSSALEGGGHDKKRRHFETPSPPPPALLSTASMEGVDVIPPIEEDCGDCINVMENFGYMDLLDNNDIWDPSSIFQFENNPQQQQKPLLIQQEEEEGIKDNGLFFLQGNSELAAIFLEWLKQNRDYISAEDMRNIKLKRSTIECASKRLGNSEEGKKQLLKLILEWVEQYQLQTKKFKETAPDSPASHYQPQQPLLQTNPNPNPNSDFNCNSNSNSNSLPPQPGWIPTPYAAPEPVYPAAAMGFVCDPYTNGGPTQFMNGNQFYPAPLDYQAMDSPGCGQSWNAQQPFMVAASPQYGPFPDNGCGIPMLATSNNNAQQVLYGNPYPYNQVYDGNGELVRLGSSATKEARKKRMARQRRLSIHHQYRHNHHNQNQNQGQVDLMNPGENCTDSNQGEPNSWVYWSPGPGGTTTTTTTAPNSSSSLPLVEAAPHFHNHLPNVQQRQASSDRREGYKTEKNLKFLLQKVLKQSDVGSLGRIVLPKKEAELHLPELDSRDGISIDLEDIGTSNVWNMRYRFWPNNKSRMYLLENTGDFVRVNELQEGDFIVIYSDTKCGKYLIRGVKVRQPGSKAEGKKPPARRNTRNLNQASGAGSFSHLAPFKQTVK